ncbi:MAG TPA: c-type cytochrome [Burkholderiales bacterium]|nr:c-type cytochrome [Burkholderiales bacterium]
MKLIKWFLTSVFMASIWLVLAPVGVAADEPIPEANPYSGDKKKIRSGRSWYRNVCGNCHGGRADGQGERGTGADLRKFKKGFKQYVQIVLDGRKVEGRIQFMPAWRGVLSQDDIYEIGAYLETLAIEGANWN